MSTTIVFAVACGRELDAATTFTKERFTPCGTQPWRTIGFIIPIVTFWNCDENRTEKKSEFSIMIHVHWHYISRLQTSITTLCFSEATLLGRTGNFFNAVWEASFLVKTIGAIKDVIASIFGRVKAFECAAVTWYFPFRTRSTAHLIRKIRAVRNSVEKKTLVFSHRIGLLFDWDLLTHHTFWLCWGIYFRGDMRTYLKDNHCIRVHRHLLDIARYHLIEGPEKRRHII